MPFTSYISHSLENGSGPIGGMYVYLWLLSFFPMHIFFQALVQFYNVWAVMLLGFPATVYTVLRKRGFFVIP